MKPVGQAVMDVPRADFRLADPLVRLARGRLPFLRGLHAHDFVRLVRLSDRDVFDCPCGARRTTDRSGNSLPTARVLIDASQIATPIGGRN